MLVFCVSLIIRMWEHVNINWVNGKRGIGIHPFHDVIVRFAPSTPRWIKAGVKSLAFGIYSF